MLKLDMFSKCFERCIVLPQHQKMRQGLCCCCWVWQARHVAEHWKLKDSAGPPWSCERVNTVGGFSTAENKSSLRIWRASVGSLKEWKFKRESDSKCFSEWRMHFLYQWRNSAECFYACFTLFTPYKGPIPFFLFLGCRHPFVIFHFIGLENNIKICQLDSYWDVDIWLAIFFSFNFFCE